eukprot:gnl/TRDRNA2_/TRDRNA2_195593_c0_seq1.p1 gnl/TRDRNA2_/TRDRNA2_195593_c0~~gnl/TRDRNA2_/TRDRNA2_195593_c0_seq1.p1  ORF type:complete len:336 (+),score=39.46 gnl/TRDRNA2_/TRDRNA2_195593_c0_seq1:86-1093(+)
MPDTTTVFQTGSWVEEVVRGSTSRIGGRCGVIVALDLQAKCAEVLIVNALRLALQPPVLQTYEQVRLSISRLRPFLGTKACGIQELKQKFVEAMETRMGEVGDSSGALGEHESDRIPANATDSRGTNAKATVAMGTTDSSPGKLFRPPPSTPQSKSKRRHCQNPDSTELDENVTHSLEVSVAKRSRTVRFSHGSTGQAMTCKAHLKVHWWKENRMKEWKSRVKNKLDLQGQGLHLSCGVDGSPQVVTFGLPSNIEFGRQAVLQTHAACVDEGRATLIVQHTSGGNGESRESVSLYVSISGAEPAELRALILELCPGGTRFLRESWLSGECSRIQI